MLVRARGSSSRPKPQDGLLRFIPLWIVCFVVVGSGGSCERDIPQAEGEGEGKRAAGKRESEKGKRDAQRGRGSSRGRYSSEDIIFTR